MQLSSILIAAVTSAVIVTGATTLISAPSTEVDGDNPSVTTVTSKPLDDCPVEWQQDFDAAVAQAKKQNRPLLWFQLLGDLTEEFC